MAWSPWWPRPGAISWPSSASPSPRGAARGRSPRGAAGCDPAASPLGATLDPLRVLTNRVLCVERTEQALECRPDGSMLAVLFIDLDDFKAINDGVGHEVGDRVLASVAARLQECLSPTDLAARVGGDEFGLLIQGLSGQADAEGVAQRVIECLTTPFPIGGEEIVVRCSIRTAVSASAADADD